MGDDRSDRELLEAWRSGDNESGNTLLVRHFAAVYRFFAGKVSTGVQDLVQQTFLACVERGDGFRGEGSFRSYLLGIARHKFIDHLRSKHGLRNEIELESRSLAGLLGSPSQVAANRQEQRVLLAALRRLPLDLQVALELHYWEEMSTAEIAEVLDVPRGTVKTRLHRAREQLRQVIAEVAGSDALAAATLANLEQWARSLRELLVDPSQP
jgi:RNA polymerase sigma-70 factor (ECF subfamily)